MLEGFGFDELECEGSGTRMKQRIEMCSPRPLDPRSRPGLPALVNLASHRARADLETGYHLPYENRWLDPNVVWMLMWKLRT